MSQMTKNLILLTRDHVRTGAAAFALVILLTQPAAALDRLLMLGGVALRPWLENTCNEVEQITDVAVLETRRYRILKLQAEAKSQVEHTALRWVDLKNLWEKAPESVRAEAKADLDKADQDVKAAVESELHVNTMAPVLLRCIDDRKTQLAALPAVGTQPPAGDGGVVACGSPGGGVVISTSVNTPCSLNVAALFGGLPANVLNDMRIETQPSHGRVDWSNGILTYTPAIEFRGRDSFTMSSTHMTAVEGQLVNAGRQDLVYVIEVQ
jgi:hypothetical protein